MGGKGRMARHIEEVILQHRGGRPHYLEPFLGGAYVFARVAPRFVKAVGSDIMPDLVMYWQAVQEGWLPPEWISREEYEALRTAPPSPLRAFAGFGCSFGGKWFGGYGVQKVDRKHPTGHVSHGSRKTTAQKAEGLKGARIVQCDYRRWAPGPDVVVYCDPPYAGTTAYDGTDGWDPEEFWATAERWARGGAAVLVSEYRAPESWTPVWSAPARASLRKDSNLMTATESVFMLQD